MSDMYNNFKNNENEQNNSDSYLNSYGTPPNNDYGTSYSYVSENNNVPKKKKRHIGLKALAVVLSFLVVGGGSIQVYKHFSDNKVSISNYKNDDSSDDDKDKDDDSNISQSDTKKSNLKDNNEENLPSLIELASRSDAMSIPDIVDSLMPSVVGVSATFEYNPSSQSYNPFSEFGFGGFGGYDYGYGNGGSSAQKLTGTGTGIVISKDGYIVTNAHVVYDSSEYNCGEAVEVSVLFSDDSEKEAKIIAYDEETDIAVLKVEATDLTPATFGDSDDIRVGELVVAIGNPLGFDLFGSVTSGIVSGLDRQISINEKNMNLIQIDAAINAGNSGGPLVNSCGQVIGINSAKMSSSYSSSEASIEGLGFAIPIDEAKKIIDDLINFHYVKGRPQIGINTKDVTETVSRYYNMPMGVYVAGVQEGSTAEFAGLKVGDVIIGINGEAVTNSEELNEEKNKYSAGEEITLTVTRGGEDIEIKLVLQEANAEKASESESDD